MLGNAVIFLQIFAVHFAGLHQLAEKPDYSSRGFGQRFIDKRLGRLGVDSRRRRLGYRFILG